MATSYSFVVTITYFIVYVSIFLIASIVCAMKIRTEYKEQKIIRELTKDEIKKWSKKGLIKQWAKLLWQKKKVYLQLIPHFFDQATDFGVIFEYWSLRNDDLGINTLYLFYISIFVIILHRIVSSIAIYRLTNNKKFILYQIFDVLMIQCIWTNYQLNTDQPSNSQRYLQILEATFESAPQLLISTAFLVKATTSSDERSAIVILSLITSFWSLSGRVAADDKTMFRDDWKSIDLKCRRCEFQSCCASFDDDWDEDEICCKFKNCCFNIKWFIRVILWRFLEISSRIILVTLIWINMGGISIFIILGIEFTYLSVICFGLGTVDMYGNIIYLMAAKSNKKSEEWAITLTIYFWVYRVISSYIFLILITIFATTQFDTDKIEDYETRYYQTIENQFGFGLFIFCWVTTPIWQWIGAICIFDYGNLASVGRDVAQLMQDNKWLDALELIKFGANFDGQDTLRMLCNGNKQKQIEEKEKKDKNIDIKKQREEQFNMISEICLTQIQIKNVHHMFFEAIKDNETETVKYYLNNSNLNINVNGIDDNGRCGLFYAASNNDIDIIQLLVKHYNADCCILDDNGLSVIHYMFNNENYENFKKINKKKFVKKASSQVDRLNIIKCLFENGNFNFNVNIKDGNGISIFISAINTNQSWKIQKYLIQRGVVIESETDIISDKIRNLLLCYGFMRNIQPSSINDNNEENVNMLFESILIDTCFQYLVDIESDKGLEVAMAIDPTEENMKTTFGLKRNDNIDEGCAIWAAPILLLLAFIMGFYFATDIAILVINNKNDCNAAINTDYISFPLNEFILSGSIIHLIAAICWFIINGRLCVRTSRSNTDIVNTVIKPCYAICGCCMYLFFISWNIIGFMLHSEMNANSFANKQCKDVMLAWNILRLIELTFGSCLMIGLWSFLF